MGGVIAASAIGFGNTGVWFYLVLFMYVLDVYVILVSRDLISRGPTPTNTVLF